MATELTIGRAIRAIREQAGESPEFAADVLGISLRQLAQLEAGEKLPAPELVDLVATLYGFDPLLLVALARLEFQPVNRVITWTLTQHRELMLRAVGDPPPEVAARPPHELTG